MARQFFSDLPDTSTPLRASRLNVLLDGEEPLGNIVVDSIRSKNMFGAYTFLNGYYTSDGTYNTAATNGTFEFIEVKPNTTYVFSLSSSIRTINISEFNSSKTWTKRTLSSNNVSSFSITTASTTKYIALCLNIDNSTTVTSSAIENLSPQLEEGSSATTYAPYQELNPDNFKNEEIVVGSIRSKNLLSYFMQGSIDSSTGGLITRTTYITSNLIKVKPNTTYCFSYESSLVNRIERLGTFNINGTFIERINLYSNSFTTNANTYYINFDLTNSNGLSPNDITNAQLEEGTQATEYSPHQDLVGFSEPIVLLDYTPITQGEEYTLNEPISNYRYIIVQLSSSASDANTNRQYIPVSLIKGYDNSHRVAISVFQSTSVYMFGDFYFSASNKIYCYGYTKGSTGWTARLKVYGLK